MLYILWVLKHLFTVILLGIFIFLFLWFFFRNLPQREKLKPAQRPSSSSKCSYYDELSRLVFGYVRIFQIKCLSFFGHLLRKSVKNLNDLKWESLSDDLDYVAYSMNMNADSMNVNGNFSDCRKQCLFMNATLPAIPKNAKSMFYFQKALKHLSTNLKAIVVFMHFDKEDMPNIVHEVNIYRTENEWRTNV